MCNALLLSISRSPSAPRLPFVTLGLKEWARNQRYYRDPERTYCWISCLPAFRGRHCRDVRMLDALRLQTLGTLERPQNRGDTPGALTEAVAIGLFYEPERMSPQQIGELAAKSAVLTHGSQEAVLANVVLAYAAAGILQDPEIPLKEQFRQAVAAMQGQFPGQDADALSAYLLPVINTEDTSPSREVLENLQCLTARECLAGAVYACLTCGDDFDRAMIAALMDKKGRVIYNVLDWKYGFTTATAVGGEAADRVAVTKYISKYMTKNTDTDRIGGRYYLHGGDIRPVIYRYANTEYNEAQGFEFCPTAGVALKIESLI